MGPEGRKAGTQDSGMQWSQENCRALLQFNVHVRKRMCPPWTFCSQTRGPLCVRAKLPFLSRWPQVLLVSAHRIPANFTSPAISQLLFSLRIRTITADFGRIKRKKRKRIVYLLTMNQTDLMSPTCPKSGS